MRTLPVKIILGLLWIGGLRGPAAAGILYCAADRVVRVSDYPAAWPCTPERLWARDRQAGWGVMAYDETRDVYTLNASLWVGAADGTETYFQIGRAGHTNEMLIVNGNVVVYPDTIKDQNPEPGREQAEKKVNRVTIGDATNAAIKAALKIGSAKGNERSLYVGVVPLPSNAVLHECRGGQIHVYNGTITAAIQDNEHAIGAPGEYRMVYLGYSRVLQGATVSWMAGFIYGGGSSSNTIFEHVGTAMVPGDPGRHVGSVFRNLKMAVLDYGSCNEEFVDCVFTNNECNWSLCNGGKGIVTIDCQIAPPARGDAYRGGEDPKTKIRKTPAWISRRHVVVAVTDEAGAAVTNAAVQVRAEQEGDDLIENGKVTVDQAGKTPGQGAPKAILLTEQITRAGDKPGEPATATFTYAVTHEFTYGIRVTAPGYATGEMAGFKPGSSWAIVPVKLKAKGAGK